MRRDRTKACEAGLALLSLWMLAACTPTATNTPSAPTPQVTASPTANPFACQGRLVPLVDSEFILFSPDCSCVTSVTKGPSWNGLTIGESTLEDVRSTFGVEGFQSARDNGWRFRQGLGPDTWYKAKACFVSDKLSVLFVGKDQDLRLKSLEQIVAQYGHPDRVTWGPTYDLRALIWSETGVMIFMKVIADRPDGPILLFSPIPSEALETSWLLASLPDGLVGAPPEDVELPPEAELEDPWGIER